MLVKHVSFDFWNTLARPNPEFARVRNQYLSHFFNIGVDEMKEIYTRVKKRLDFNAEFTGVQGNVNDAIKALCDETETSYNEHDITIIRLNLSQLFMMHRPIFPDGLAEAVNKLHTKGISTNITSNTNFISGFVLRKCIEHMCFNFTLFSDIYQLAKPSKKFFGIIPYELDLQPHEILHVGDNELADIKGGESMGFKTSLVKNPDETLTVINNILAL